MSLYMGYFLLILHFGRDCVSQAAVSPSRKPIRLNSQEHDHSIGKEEREHSWVPAIYVVADRGYNPRIRTPTSTRSGGKPCETDTPTFPWNFERTCWSGTSLLSTWCGARESPQRDTCNLTATLSPISSNCTAARPVKTARMR